jgi:hypothetical protein
VQQHPKFQQSEPIPHRDWISPLSHFNPAR